MLGTRYNRYHISLRLGITAYKQASTAAKKYGMEGNLVAGANLAGFEKVANAMLWEGVSY